MSYVFGAWAKASHSHLSAALFLGKQGPPPPEAAYNRLLGDIQRRLVARAQLLIACDDDNRSQILGYCLYEPAKSDSPPVLHYVQVKRDLMRKRIASALLDHAGINRDAACIYTFTSPIQGKVKTPDAWVYVPHWLIGDK